jgi:solute carrier family 35, member E1
MMPHSTNVTGAMAPDQLVQAKVGYSESNGSATGTSNGIEKFPDFETEPSRRSPSSSRAAGDSARDRSVPPADRWMPRADHQSQGVRWTAPQPDRTSHSNKGHSRQKSFSQAIRNMRSGSVSQNAHEIADALRAPVSWTLIVRAPCFWRYGPSRWLTYGRHFASRRFVSCGTGPPL